ncbi:MAG: TRAP transporter small permease subunit [Ideonella sp.]|nr:TRAP transporter small permease subunit [Ideonella sp.]MCC7457167.1 TRAP transporter small permease subunit [Nitrospira sp.]
MSVADSGLARIARRLDTIAIWSGRSACWLLLPMVLGLSYEVVARYLFNAPTIWAYDLTFMLYGSFFLLGAAFTLQRKGHVRTDSLYADWSPRAQAAVDLVCYFVIFLPFVGVLVFVGWGYFIKAYTTGETFVTSAWQPLTWPLKLALPLGGALLLVQGASEVLKCLHTIRTGDWPDRRHHSGVQA